MIRGVMLTHKTKFNLAVRTMRHLGHFDHLTILVPAGQRRALERRIACPVRGPFPNLTIKEHDVLQRTSEGLVRYGALRHRQMDVLLSSLGQGDTGLMIDDDLNQAQSVNVQCLTEFTEQATTREGVAQKFHGRKWEHLGPAAQDVLRRRYDLIQLTHRMTSLQVRQRVLAMSRLVSAQNPSGFFTFGYIGRSSNALVKRRVPTRWVKWSGVLGVLPGSQNPFDPEMNSCEDWDAAGRILCDFNVPLIADPATAFNMGLESKKYVSGGPLYSDRMAACDALIQRYQFRGHQVFHRARTAVGQLPSLTCNKTVMNLLQEAAA